MNFSALISRRFSVRSYLPQVVDEQTILQVLEAGRLAPSAVNFQPFQIVVVTDDEQRLKVQDAYPREWFKQAPVYLVVCAEPQKAWVRASDQKNFADVDVAIVVDHLVLQATDLGLGTCWVCNFDVELCCKALSLPTELVPLAIVSMGFSAEVPNGKKRKPLAGFIHWNRYLPQ